MAARATAADTLGAAGKGDSGASEGDDSAIGATFEAYGCTQSACPAFAPGSASC